MKTEETGLIIKEIKTALVDIKTPEKYIKVRPGKGGKSFSYVETGYVIKTLNDKFNWKGVPLWSFKIIEQQIGASQIWVKGQLTVQVATNVSIVKEQFGSSDIKKSQAGAVLSIGDDLKAAGSDALKKCASMLDIASDVYWQGDNDTISENMATMPQLKKIATLCSVKGYDREALKAEYHVPSAKDLTLQQASEIIERLEKLPDKEKKLEDNLKDTAKEATA